MPRGLQNTSWTNAAVAIIGSQFEWTHLLEKMFIILSETLQSFFTRIQWIKQCSSLIDPTILKKLQFIRIKQINMFSKACQ